MVRPLTPVFSQAILNWYDQQGRHDLPWRQTISAYRVWVSEIMLQQTQVTTVLPYFQRFMQRFPELANLAAADEEEVLVHWAGLGYYSRARNLHRTARHLMQAYQGQFPQTVTQLQALPGIGRSTAGAIASIAFQQPAPILDGNVKRVLARWAGIAGWPGKNAVAEQLWHWATTLLPTTRAADYTQAMMDLGAMVCTRQQPQCNRCPIQQGCVAFRDQTQALYPTKKLKKMIPQKSLVLLLLRDARQRILLIKRPPTGIWGGLWSLPESTTPEAALHEGKIRYGCELTHHQIWPKVQHTLTHFHLEITPIIAHVTRWQPPLMENTKLIWQPISQHEDKALPAPVKRLIQQLKGNTHD